MILSATVSFFMAGLWGLHDFSPYLAEVKSNYLAWSLQAGEPVNFVSWPTRMKSFFPRRLLLSERWYRLPNLLVTAIDLFAIGWFVYKFGPGGKWLPVLAVISLAITPLFIHSSVFDFASVLAIGVFLGLLYSIQIRKWWLAGICLVLFASSTLYADGLGWQIYPMIQPDFAAIKLEVDNRIRTEYRINARQDILPITIKRLVYNKYFWVFRQTLPEWVKLGDFDWWLAPSQIGSTVSRNIWSEKGLPRVLFFQAILVVYALFTLTPLHRRLANTCLIALVVIWLVSSLGAAEVLERTAAPVLIPVSILSAVGLIRLWATMWGKLAAIATIAIAFSGITAFLHHFTRHESYWRDNRPAIFSQMTSLLDHCTGEPTIASNILGPSQYYYAWSNHIPPRLFWQTDPDAPQINTILFKHFDLSKEADNSHSCFVGLPGEFLGNRSGQASGQNEFTPQELPPNLKLVKAVTFRDSVSYGNGNFIWLIKKDI